LIRLEKKSVTELKARFVSSFLSLSSSLPYYPSSFFFCLCRFGFVSLWSLFLYIFLSFFLSFFPSFFHDLQTVKETIILY
jgi:hypothetical protein